MYYILKVCYLHGCRNGKL